MKMSATTVILYTANPNIEQDTNKLTLFNPGD